MGKDEQNSSPKRKERQSSKAKPRAAGEALAAGPSEGEAAAKPEPASARDEALAAGEVLDPVPDEVLEPTADEPNVDAVIVEAAVTAEFELLEEFGKGSADAIEELGREELGVTESAACSFAKILWEAAADTASYSRDSLDSSSEFVGNLLQAKSPAALARLQAGYAHGAYTRFVNHFFKLNQRYWELAEEILKRAGANFANA